MLQWRKKPAYQGRTQTICLNTVEGAVKANDKVQLVGFGTFESRERAAREGKNPRTGEKITITASKIPAFKAGKAFKDLLK